MGGASLRGVAISHLTAVWRTPIQGFNHRHASTKRPAANVRSSMGSVSSESACFGSYRCTAALDVWKAASDWVRPVGSGRANDRGPRHRSLTDRRGERARLAECRSLAVPHSLPAVGSPAAHAATSAMWQRSHARNASAADCTRSKAVSRFSARCHSEEGKAPTVPFSSCFCIDG